MKFYPKLNKYKASNVELDLNSGSAWSYGWWKFYDEKTDIFNRCPYSPTTQRHQQKVLRVLRNLGKEPTFFFYFTRLSLSSVDIEVFIDEYRLTCLEIDGLELDIKQGRDGSQAQKERYTRHTFLNNHLLNLKLKCEKLFPTQAAYLVGGKQ